MEKVGSLRLLEIGVWCGGECGFRGEFGAAVERGVWGRWVEVVGGWGSF